MNVEVFGQLSTIVFTIGIWSLLWKDNPLYRITEHVMTGAAAGYYLVVNWHFIVDTGFVAIASGKIYYVIAIIVGILVFTNLIPKYQWVSRYPLSIVVGTATGLIVSTMINTNILRQLSAMTVNFGKTLTPFGQFNNILMLVFTCTVIYYFTYMAAFRSPKIDFISRFGRFALMVAFGVSYGQTVTYRLNLVITQMNVLLADNMIYYTAGVLVVVVAALALWTYMKKK